MSVPLDSMITLNWLTYSDSQRTTLADPTAITLDVLAPDNTTTTYAWPGGAQIIHDTTGTFHIDLGPLTTRGHYAYEWKATGAVTTSQPGSFDVEPKYGAWITLADAKNELNIPSADTSNDDELQRFINAAVETIENIVGPLTPTPYTETHPGYTTTVVLDRYPVVSIDTVTEYDSNGTGTVLADEPLGSTYTDLGYRPDLTIGTLTRTSGGAESRFKTQITVTYTAGRAFVPDSVHQGALELVRHMWETQRGNSTGRPIPGYDQETPQTFGIGYLVPNRVLELLAPYRKAPKVA